MNGKNFFRACCNQMGIHCDTRFKLGAQNSKNSGGYVYHCPPELRTREQRYAVNYISDRDIYLAWDLSVSGTENKTVFRVRAGELENHGAGQGEIHSQDAEAVRVGKRDGVCVRPGGGEAISDDRIR